MLIDIKIGDKVTYFNGHSIQHGIIKNFCVDSTNDVLNDAFVVYNCDNNWDRYYNYTSQKTKISDLHYGWVDMETMVICNKRKICVSQVYCTLIVKSVDDFLSYPDLPKLCPYDGQPVIWKAEKVIKKTIKKQDNINNIIKTNKIPIFNIRSI